MNPALKLPFTPALTHLAEGSSGYHKISDAKAHLVSINCWIFFFFFCRSGHDLNPSTHSILACLSEGCGSSRPPSASQISAEVLQSRLQWSVFIPQRGTQGCAPSTCSWTQSPDFRSKTWHKNAGTYLNGSHLIHSARRQTRQGRRHPTRSPVSYASGRFKPIRNNVIISGLAGRWKL